MIFFQGGIVKKYRTLLILIVLSLLACNNEKPVSETEILCPEKPLKGIVKLKVEKVLTIDSLIIAKEKPPVFGFLVKDKKNYIFIGSNRPETRIYQFDSSGVFLKEFLSKGEGPGELKAIHRLQHIGDSIMASSNTKTVEYDTGGNYISETRFKRLYSQITFVDKQHFIANHYRRGELNAGESKRVCSLISKSDENVIVGLLKSDRRDIGRTIIKDNEGKVELTVNLYGITPDYLSVYDLDNNSIIQCLTDESRFFIKNSKGELKKVVNRDFDRKVFNKDDMNEIMDTFVHFPDNFKNMVKKNLPKKMLAISSIKLLPKGYFAVFYYKSFDKNEICIFDKERVFQYLMEFPDDKSNIRSIFTNNGFARVETAEERDLYVEYQITNLPEIFNN